MLWCAPEFPVLGGQRCVVRLYSSNVHDLNNTVRTRESVTALHFHLHFSLSRSRLLAMFILIALYSVHVGRPSGPGLFSTDLSKRDTRAKIGSVSIQLWWKRFVSYNLVDSVGHDSNQDQTQ